MAGGSGENPRGLSTSHSPPLLCGRPFLLQFPLRRSIPGHPILLRSTHLGWHGVCRVGDTNSLFPLRAVRITHPSSVRIAGAMLRGSRPWRERTRQVQEFLYPESLMSPSGRLCLLTILSLILPSRGQKLEESTPALAVHPATPVPGEDKGTDVTDSEFQTISTLQTWTRAADGLQTSQSQREAETETQQPTIMDTTFPATKPETHSETHTASKEGSTAPPRIVPPRIGPPVTREDIWQKFLTYKPRDWKKDSPFYYDTHTLRMRGLLVAAVLFITGIIILTSGKCRHLYGICRNHNRAYNVVNTRNLQKEEVPGGSQP